MIGILGGMGENQTWILSHATLALLARSTTADWIQSVKRCLAKAVSCGRRALPFAAIARAMQYSTNGFCSGEVFTQLRITALPCSWQMFLHGKLHACAEQLRSQMVNRRGGATFMGSHVDV